LAKRKIETIGDNMIHKRRRGAAIVETKKGILVVSWDKKLFMLPGGGANFLETRRKAAIRELEEETGLKAKSAEYLFNYITPVFNNRKGEPTRNHAKVYLIEAEGIAKPKSEVKHIDYWKPGSKLKLMAGATIALEKYFKEFK
jgi:8-oxo-dGTP pyrophosphatase MutT (NUDIX family)